MPAVHNYVVTQTRRVVVSAETPGNAAAIATKAFGSVPAEEHVTVGGIWGNTTTTVRPVELTVKEV